jgi:hypothetical protein
MTAAGFGRQSREARSPCERGQAPLNLDTAAAPWVAALIASIRTNSSDLSQWISADCGGVPGPSTFTSKGAHG